MKKYVVIGNPIEHSLSPKLHGYWFKKYGIDAIYEKAQVLDCLLYTSPSPRDVEESRMPSSA